MAKQVDSALNGSNAGDILGMRLDKQTDPVQLANSLLADERSLRESSSNAPSLGNKLTSLPGILTALGVIGSAVAKRPDISAGLMSGFLQQANADVARDTQAHQKQMDLDASNIAQKRSALNMVFQANPESFLDAKGRQTIDETLLGYALTGHPVAISASSRLAIDERNKTQENQIEAAREAFVRATDADGRKRALSLWSDAAKLNWTDDDVSALAGHDSLNGFFISLMDHADANTVLDAMLKANALGIETVNDPGFTSVMSGVRGVPSGSQQIPEKWETAGTLISEWVAEDFQTRIQMNPLDQAQAALVTRPDLLAEYTNRYSEQLSEDIPVTVGEYVSMYNDLTIKILQAGNFNPDLVQKLSDPTWARGFLTANVDNTIQARTTQHRIETANQWSSLFDHAIGEMTMRGLTLDNNTFDSLSTELDAITAQGLDVKPAQAVLNKWLDGLAPKTTPKTNDAATPGE